MNDIREKKKHYMYNIYFTEENHCYLDYKISCFTIKYTTFVFCLTKVKNLSNFYSYSLLYYHLSEASASSVFAIFVNFNISHIISILVHHYPIYVLIIVNFSLFYISQ